MPTTEAQKRATMKWRENNKEKYACYMKEFHKKRVGELAALRARILELESKDQEPQSETDSPNHLGDLEEK